MMQLKKIGRPRIDGLARFGLRLQETQLGELDAFILVESARRNDPALNRTDIIREAVAEYLAKRAELK